MLTPGTRVRIVETRGANANDINKTGIVLALSGDSYTGPLHTISLDDGSYCDCYSEQLRRER